MITYLKVCNDEISSILKYFITQNVILSIKKKNKAADMHQSVTILIFILRFKYIDSKVNKQQKPVKIFGVG